MVGHSAARAFTQAHAQVQQWVVARLTAGQSGQCAHVARLCRVLPIKHVAERFGLDWHTVKAIDKAWLARTLPPLDMTGVTKLIMVMRLSRQSQKLLLRER